MARRGRRAGQVDLIGAHFRETSEPIEARMRGRINAGGWAPHRGRIASWEAGEQELAVEIDRLISRQADTEEIGACTERRS